MRKKRATRRSLDIIKLEPVVAWHQNCLSRGAPTISGFFARRGRCPREVPTRDLDVSVHRSKSLRPARCPEVSCWREVRIPGSVSSPRWAIHVRGLRRDCAATNAISLGRYYAGFPRPCQPSQASCMQPDLHTRSIYECGLSTALGARAGVYGELVTILLK